MRVIVLLIAATLFYKVTAQVEKQDSLEIKIGQMLLIGIGNDTVLNKNGRVANAIKNRHAGGVILFEKNIAKKDSEKKLEKLISDLQEVSDIPLYVSIDQEGGRVNRLKTKYGFPKMESAKYLGDLDNLDSTKYYGDVTASVLSRLGFNVNFAPVLDVHNKVCPVLGKFGRCYSSDVEIITKHAGQVIDSHTEHHVLTALKHFPGHGNSISDTHFGVADVTDTWKEEELVPYRELIQQGKVDMIMTAHIVNGKLDSNLKPSTLSHEIITGLLRDSLGYDGIVISDDMQMDAISKKYGVYESAKMAILAGVDILLFSNNSYNESLNMLLAEEVVLYIKEKVLAGEIPEQRINESYQRIMRQKNKLAEWESEE